MLNRECTEGLKGRRMTGFGRLVSRFRVLFLENLFCVGYEIQRFRGLDSCLGGLLVAYLNGY